MANLPPAPVSPLPAVVPPPSVPVEAVTVAPPPASQEIAVRIPTLTLDPPGLTAAPALTPPDPSASVRLPAARPAPRPAPYPQGSRQARPPPAQPGGGSLADSASAPSAGAVAVTGVTIGVRPDPNFPRPDPPYPNASRIRGEQGQVAVTIVVGADGRAQSVRILRSSGSLALDESARRTILTAWRFLPAMRDGQPIADTTSTSILFTLQ